ncbi:MAG: polysaccharide biosynthesis/export family protein [Syntrophobacterales bacterium]|jgi:polysaccharide export outer membrane protein|nr:polysaccharide biosynthesis/export family protein [Syntrophobacterales bacterium]
MKLRQTWLMVLGAGLLIAGCAGPAARGPTQDMVSQVEAQAKNKRFNETLMAQAGPTTPTNFRDYQVGPEDLLAVQIFGQDNLSREVRVDGQGQIFLPLVENVKVKGLTAAQIEQRLMKLYDKEFLVNPQISVFVKEYRYQRVSITGAVNTPGSYPMIGRRTLLEMLAQAGGVKDGSADVIHIVRRQNSKETSQQVKTSEGLKSFSPNTETILIDLKPLLKVGPRDLNIPLQHGDVVYVPYAGFAYVLGEVKAPGPVPVKQNLRVTQAIASAKGLNEIASQNRTTILRFDEQGQRVTIPVNYDRVTKGEDPDVPLKEDDIVFIPGHLGKKAYYELKTFIRGSVGMALPVQ